MVIHRKDENGEGGGGVKKKGKAEYLEEERISISERRTEIWFDEGGASHLVRGATLPN